MPRQTQHAGRGFTLVEVLVSVSVLGIIALVLGSLAVTVQTGHAYIASQGEAAQHARVVLTRMERILSEAHASEDFPGFAVFAEQVEGWSFPDTLVVWHPDGTPSHAEGPPLFRELVVFCPDPVEPSQLLEIRSSTDSRSTPPLSDTLSWLTELALLKQSSRVERVTLTNLVRIGTVKRAGLTSQGRGAVFFHTVVRPSPSEWQQFQNGNLAWEDLPWAQSIHGSRSGLRQSWCSIELQLMPAEEGQGLDLTGDRAVPFFGSAAVYHDLNR